MRFPIILIIVFLSSSLQGQTLDGLWISAYQMNVQQITERLDPPNEAVLLDQIELDTFYQEAFGLIEFLNSHELIFKGLGNPERKVNYVQNVDTIITKVDTLKLKFLINNNRLTLLDPDSSWQFNHFVFERLTPDSTKPLEFSSFEIGSYWQVDADTTSLNFGLEVFFLDSGEVIISQFSDDLSRTSIGDYHTDTFKNNLFLYLLDGYSLDQKMIRFYDWNQSFLKAQSYEFGFGDEPPILTSFQLNKLELPSKKSRKTIEKTVVGSWRLLDTGVPFYSEFSDYDSLENEYFNFTITKSDFEITYGAEFIKQDQRDLLTETINGTWTLGPTGRFLEMTYSNGQISYLTISELTKDSFAFNLSLKTPDSHHGYRSNKIKLKGANN